MCDNPNLVGDRMWSWRPEYDLMWWERVPELVRAASEIRSKAYSYRENPFLVGVAILTINPFLSSGRDRFRVFQGMNTKFCKCCPKWCGEMYGLTLAEQAAFTRIIGMVIVAENQVDNESGKLLEVLTPCGACRDFFRKKRHMFTPQTHIMGVRIPDFHVEGLTIAKLYSAHDEEPLF